MLRYSLCSALVLLAVVACSDREGIPGATAPTAAQFAKTPPIGDPTATFYFPLADAALGMKSDQLYAAGANSAYANNVCGVDAKIFATTELSNSGDAVMQTDNPRFSDRKCPSYPRTITFAFAVGLSETVTTFMNVRNIANTTTVIPIGATVTRIFSANSTRCGAVFWGSLRQGVLVPGDSVTVTRTASDTWHVQTQPAPNDRAFCVNTGESFHMPVDYTIVTSRALP